MKKIATPRTLVEAVRRFADPEVAHAYVVQMRWPNGVACPYCGCVGPTFMQSVRRWQCKDCRKQFSVKVGTIFEDSKIGLDKWLCAFWMVANCKNGISSYEMHRALGVTQKTAWFMDHRIRLAMQNGSIEKLGGAVEADETYVGGKAANMHLGKRHVQGRGAVGKTAVVGLLERHGELRVMVVMDTKASTLHRTVRTHVVPGSKLYTDHNMGYRGLKFEYDHDFVSHIEEYVRGEVHTNGLENFWSLLKRCIKGTYVSVDPWHLSRYCDEQAFRFNHRKDNDGGSVRDGHGPDRRQAAHLPGTHRKRTMGCRVKTTGTGAVGGSARAVARCGVDKSGRPIRRHLRPLQVMEDAKRSGSKGQLPLYRHSVVSLFSGCGGLDLGFRGDFEFLGTHYDRLPFDVAWANDISPAACRTYAHNLGGHIVCGDVWQELDRMPEKADVVIGGFPCQDFSINGKRAGTSGARGGLFHAMVEAVRRIQPRVFVAENVKGLLQKYNRDSLCEVVSAFESLGYDVTYQLYLAADYGVPQMRQRVFFVGTRPDVRPFAPPFPTVTRDFWVTCKAAIGDLEDAPEDLGTSHIWSRANKSHEQGNRILKADRPSDTIRAECHGNIQFHYNLPRRMSMREAARMQSFPDSFLFQSKLRETERMVGNAVPPVLAWHMARSVAECLQ